MPKRCRFDYRLFDVQITGVGEFKYRTVAYGYYPDLGLFLTKWHAVRREAERLDVPPYIFARFTDGLYWAYAHESNVSRYDDNWGRTDRNDRHDKQPSLFVRNDAFERVT